MKHLFFAFLFVLSANIYAQSNYGELHLTDDEVESINYYIKSLRNAIENNRNVSNATKGYRSTLSNIISRYEAYLWNGGDNVMIEASGLYEDYLSEVLKMNQNAKKVLNSLHKTYTPIGNLYNSDSREEKITTFN